MNPNIVMSAIIAGVTVFGIAVMQTPLEIEKAQYSALQDEYAFTLEMKSNEIKRLELRVRELELLASKERVK